MAVKNQRQIKPALLIEGMLGLGDNISARAIVRHRLLTHEVWMTTPWPSVFWDLDVKCLRVPTEMRTQKKNAAREYSRYYQSAPNVVKHERIWYEYAYVKQYGSFLKATLHHTDTPMSFTDYRLPIQESWDADASWLLRKLSPKKPVMIFRPLVSRIEWEGCGARNPDVQAYSRLFQSIRDRYFVISVADLSPGIEWISGILLDADATFHGGELHAGVLAALVNRSALVFCSPGFAVVMASAVGTPTVLVCGGHESSRLYAADALCPFLGIDPASPDECFTSSCTHSKTIDLVSSTKRLKEFCDANRSPTIRAQPARSRPVGVARAVP